MGDYNKDLEVVESGQSGYEFPTNNRYSQQESFIFRIRSYIAEFFGTLILVTFGCGVIAQVTFNKAAIGSSFLSINLGWGLGLAMGILVAGPISGAHLNPAVTFANALFGRFSWFKVPGYIFAQNFGAFLGAAIVYLIYWPAFSGLDGGIRRVLGSKGTAGIFATYPHPENPAYNAFFTELILTSFLLVGVLAITNPKHKVPNWGAALAIGGLLTSIGLSVGMMTGYAMNPARDFGPRLFTAIAGWGSGPFSAHGYYFWVPILAPFIGASLGMAIYLFIIDTE